MFKKEAFIWIVTCLVAWTVASNKKPFDSSKLDTFVESVMKCRNVPAVTLSVVKLDERDNPIISYAKAYGKVDPSCQLSNCEKPSATKTKFCIGSITKSFAAAIIGQVLMESKFNETLWDTKIKDLLPCNERNRFKGDDVGHKITIRDLLSHRTGIQSDNMVLMFGTDAPRSEVWKNLFRNDEQISPNEADDFRASFKYNNRMYALTGHIAEMLTNDTWEHLVDKYYFKPLNMKSSTFVHKVGDFENIAKFGSYKDKKWIVSKEGLDFVKNIYYAAPAGGICSTSSDMLEYMKYLLSGTTVSGAVSRKILTDTFQAANILPTMFKIDVHEPSYPLYIDANTYGMGWFLGSYRGYRNVQHAGGLTGFLSNLYVLKDAKIGVFISTTNHMFGRYKVDDISETLGYYALDLLLDKEPFIELDKACSIYPQAFYNVNTNVLTKEEINATDSPDVQFECSGLANEFKRFHGIYQSQLYSKLVVKGRDDGQLEFTLGKSAKGRLCRTNPPSGEDPLQLKMVFEGALETYNQRSPLLFITGTVKFHTPKSSEEKPSVTALFLDAAIYKWISPTDVDLTGTPITLQGSHADHGEQSQDEGSCSA